jgi:prophage regulatory protein
LAAIGLQTESPLAENLKGISTMLEKADRYVREKECKQITGLSCSTRERHMKMGIFPQSYSIGPRAKAWKLSEIMIWLNSQPGRFEKLRKLQSLLKPAA